MGIRIPTIAPLQAEVLGELGVGFHERDNTYFSETNLFQNLESHLVSNA